MHISRIAIANFRNFACFDVSVGKSIVLIGENNSGKSNLLYALRLLLDPNLPDSVRKLDEDDFWEGLERPFAANKIEITVEFTNFEDNDPALSVLSDAIIREEPKLTAQLTYSFRPKDTLEIHQLPPIQLKREHYEVIYYGKGDDTSRLSPEFRSWIPLELLPALRDTKSDLNSWKKSPLRPLIESVEDKIDSELLIHLARQIDDVTKALLEEPNIENLQSAIINRLIEMLEQEEDIDPRLGFVPTDETRLLRLLRLFADGGLREMDEIGLGYSNVMYLVLLLLALDRREEVNEVAATILAIEEPEAHLHPHVQRLVFQHLLKRSEVVSVIISTHSPYITSVTSLESIVLLKITDEGTVGRTIHNAHLSEQDTLDLQRYIDITRAEFFFSKGVILVEGITEEFVVPALARKLAAHLGIRSLDSQGISVVNIEGTDFVPYVKLLGKSGFDLPFYIITDGDIQESDDGQLSYQGLERGKRILLTINDTLESSIENLSQDALLDVFRHYNIFIGNHTLEIDLADAGCRDPILTTFSELGATSRKLAETTDLLGNWDNIGVTDKRKLIALVEYLAKKGRFAQRLAEKLELTQMPAYLRDALHSAMGIV